MPTSHHRQALSPSPSSLIVHHPSFFPISGQDRPHHPFHISSHLLPLWQEHPTGRPPQASTASLHLPEAFGSPATHHPIVVPTLWCCSPPSLPPIPHPFLPASPSPARIPSTDATRPQLPALGTVMESPPAALPAPLVEPKPNNIPPSLLLLLIGCPPCFQLHQPPSTFPKSGKKPPSHPSSSSISDDKACCPCPLAAPRWHRVAPLRSPAAHCPPVAHPSLLPFVKTPRNGASPSPDLSPTPQARCLCHLFVADPSREVPAVNSLRTTTTEDPSPASLSFGSLPGDLGSKWPCS